MLYLFRPYVGIYKSVKCLSIEHKALMKLNSYLILNVIYQKKKWTPKDDTYELYKNDQFVKFYYNKGRPYVNVLIEYYYASYFYWLKNCGDKVDFFDEMEDIYQKHIDECEDSDPWTTRNKPFHKLFLIEYDEFWYKRHFMDYYRHRIKDHRFFIKGEPREVKYKEIIKLENDDDGNKEK